MARIEVRKYQALEHIASMFVIKTGAVILGILFVIYILFVKGG